MSSNMRYINGALNPGPPDAARHRSKTEDEGRNSEQKIALCRECVPDGGGKH
jgi:hypothetical protein